MKLVGITGGIGMGKTACSDLLRQRGLPVIDTDELARQIVEPGQPALNKIRELFGPAILDPQGRLRRSELARIVFPDLSARQRLEAILHPRIRELWRTEARQWRDSGVPLGFVVIPLLFETHAEQELDATICVACSASTQRTRLEPRGWSLEQFRLRNQAQMPVEEKMGRSNYVIWNEASIEVHSAQLDRILKAL